MKAVLPKPVHESYKRHRKQLTSQIMLPVIVASLLFLVAVVLVGISANLGNPGVATWAQISTMWIAIPTCLMGFVFLALLGGLVFLLGKLLGVAPTYTGRAQDFVHKLAIRIRRAADKTVKPIISLNGFGASIRAFLGRK
jgi:hypothetical protein